VQVAIVTVPDFPPSEIVMVFGALPQFPVRSVIVKLLDGAVTYPLPLAGVIE
jgi:hypothetical protein